MNQKRFVFLMHLGGNMWQKPNNLKLYKKERIGKNEVFYGLMIGVPNFFAAKFLLKALESVAAVIAYPTYSVATILTVTLAGVLFFKEKLGKRQWLAVGIILVAVVLLNL